MPELLTVSISSFNGLLGASIFNILSSNVINLIQYIGTIILNKNFKLLKNKALMFDMFLVFITILIPVTLIINNIPLNMYFVPAFIILYFLFLYLNAKTHIRYLEEDTIEEETDEPKRKNNLQIIKYFIILLLTGVMLFFISNRLGDVLENLCYNFNISQTIVGILLGFLTSIPELITFFEAQRHYKSEKNEIFGVVEATNNLLTSNILNLFLIQSLGIAIVAVV